MKILSKLKEKLAGSKLLKGKLTYTGIAAFLAPLLAQWLGIDVAPEQVLLVLQAVGVVVALVGNWRAHNA